MRILHYTLGLPPNRSGGLTKYATDLMIAQSNQGEEVFLIYPGDYTFWKIPKMEIVQRQKYFNISAFEIQNPIPVPLLHGIKHPKSIFSPKQILSRNAIEQFYAATKPDILHLHTLMGLPSELLDFFKEKGVKIVFTSHDYYGLCLKVNFINNKGLYCTQPEGRNCAICNSHAPSSLFLQLRNSNYILKHKRKLTFERIKARPQTRINHKEINPNSEQISEFSNLIKHYLFQLQKIDFFHFNSNVTREVFEYHLGEKHSVVESITHSDISDKRKLKIFDKNHIRLGFIGSIATYKGFQLLKDVLMELHKNDIKNWSLQVWGGTSGLDFNSDQITYRGSYVQDQLPQVFNQMDLLIVPSICKETFSLITLEALSYGVPVLVSTNVGAKDIVKDYVPEFIFEPKKEVLTARQKAIFENTSLLNNFNEKICTGEFDYSLHKHAQNILQLYKNLLV